jgi:hypothetical protein
MWASYLSGEDVFVLLDKAISFLPEQTNDTDGLVELVEALVKTLQRILVRPGAATAAEPHLQKLITLYSRVPDLRDVECVISTALDTLVPLGLDGEFRMGEEKAMAESVLMATTRWQRRGQPRDWCGAASTFIVQPNWTNDNASIVEKMAYLHPSSHEALGQFLSSSRSTTLSAGHLARCTRAWLEGHLLVPISSTASTLGVFHQHFDVISSSLIDAGLPSVDRACFKVTLSLMFQHLSDARRGFSETLKERVLSLSKKRFSIDLALLIESLPEFDPELVGELRSTTFDYGLKWAAHTFSGPGELDVDAVHALGMSIIHRR